MLYSFVIGGTVRAGEEVIGRHDALGIWDTAGTVQHGCAADTRLLLIEVPINH